MSVDRTVQVSAKARAGAALCVVALVTLISLCVFRVLSAARPYLGWSAGALAGLGMLLVIVSLPSWRRPKDEDDVLGFWRRPSYWGGCLLAAAGVVYVVVSLCMPVTADYVPRPPPSAPTSVEFPELLVTGVVLNGERSSAVIDGQTVQLRERVGGTTLVCICERSIAVEKEGERRIYRLHDPSPMHRHPNDPVCNGAW